MHYWERYVELCQEKGENPTSVSIKVGCSKGTAAYWKKQYENGKAVYPDSRRAQALASYFNVSVDYLLGRTDVRNGNTVGSTVENEAAPDPDAPKNKKGFSRQDEVLIYALWGDADDIDEQDLEDLKTFAAFIKERKKKK